MSTETKATKPRKKYKQRKLNPRQTAFMSFYFDPTSPTFNNARQSALRAGYSEEYADNITHIGPDYMTTDVRRAAMLQKAEKNLEAITDMPVDEVKRTPQNFKTWQDTNKFIAERIGKEAYSARTEHTGKYGTPLFSDEKKQELEAKLTHLLID